MQVVCREWLPQTLTTYTNSMCKVYKRTRPTHGIVTSSDQQFPLYCAFFNNACTLARLQKSMGKPQEDTKLHGADVIKLFDQTNWALPHANQRMNLLLLAFSLRQRPEALLRFRVAQFTQGKMPNGRKYVDLTLGTVKNLPGNQKNTPKPLHKQRVVEHDNSKLCAVLAFTRQVKLLGNPTRSVFLVHSLRHASTKAPPEPMSCHTIHAEACMHGSE